MRDVGVLNASVHGSEGMTAGLLVGDLLSGGEVLNSYSAGDVEAGDGITTSLGFAYVRAGDLSAPAVVRS